MQIIKKILIFSILVLGGLNVYVINEKFKPQHVASAISEALTEKPMVEPSSGFEEIIRLTNVRADRVQNFSASVIAKSLEGTFKLDLTGDMAYSKDKKLKLELRSLLGRELLIGSNEKEFWFYSKRVSPPVLHYADYSEFSKTRLKNPFNPLMTIESLGFSRIDTTDCVVKEVDDKLILIKNIENTVGEPIVKMSFIDKTNKRPVGILITDTSGTVLASSEILEYENDLPKVVLYSWQEENHAMILEFSNAMTNSSLNEETWSRPSDGEAIDMGKE